MGHILGVARTLPFHSIGGMQAIAWDLFREFARMGHQTTVVTTSCPGREGEFVEEGVRVIPLAGTRPERCDACWWRASSKWFESGGAGRVDAVLSVSSAGAAIAARRNLAPDARFVFQAHGTSWGEFVSKWRSGRPKQWVKSARNLFWIFKDASIYRDFDRIIQVGDVLAKQFSVAPMTLIAGQTPSLVIRNGVDENVFKPDPDARRRVRAEFGWDEQDRVAVFAARMHPQKGGEIALRAFAAIASTLPAARLLMIGGGEDLDRLRALSAAIGLQKPVAFTGSVPRSVVAGLLAAGDAFVFPTVRQEGLPMNVLEALACGLRPVCSSSTREVFEQALPIAYANPHDVGEFAARLRECLMLGASGSSLLSPAYSLQGCAQRYLDVLGVGGEG